LMMTIGGTHQGDKWPRVNDQPAHAMPAGCNESD
jgi:hypothetical protein